MMNKRLGFIGIIIEKRNNVVQRVNDILSQYSHCIVARLGLPYKEKDCSVITVIVDTDTDELGKLTGTLGLIEGISVKSALSKKG